MKKSRLLILHQPRTATNVNLSIFGNLINVVACCFFFPFPSQSDWLMYEGFHQHPRYLYFNSLEEGIPTGFKQLNPALKMAELLFPVPKNPPFFLAMPRRKVEDNFSKLFLSIDPIEA